MSIHVSHATHGTTRVSTLSASHHSDTQHPAASAASPGSTAPNAGHATEQDGLKAPTPLRFPWLSRLSSELEPVAKQKPPFATLPVIGDNLDQAV